MEWLLEWDRSLLRLINIEWSNPFFDVVMPWVRMKWNWVPLYVLMVAALLWRYKKQAWFPLLIVVASVVISDQLTSTIIKPLVHRMRPCQNTFLQLRTVIHCGGGYSFVSSHAANHFALALSFPVFFLAQRLWLLPLMMAWASWIAFAQVYIGFHYPSDVVAGALIGASVSLLLTAWWRKKIENLQASTLRA